jgi:hypothetical protein
LKLLGMAVVDDSDPVRTAARLANAAPFFLNLATSIQKCAEYRSAYVVSFHECALVTHYFTRNIRVGPSGRGFR